MGTSLRRLALLVLFHSLTWGLGGWRQSAAMPQRCQLGHRCALPPATPILSCDKALAAAAKEKAATSRLWSAMTCYRFLFALVKRLSDERARGELPGRGTPGLCLWVGPIDRKLSATASTTDPVPEQRSVQRAAALTSGAGNPVAHGITLSLPHGCWDLGRKNVFGP